MSNPDFFSLNRRRFMETGLAVAASACLPGELLAAPLHPQGGNELSVGVLWPQSKQYPNLGPELLAGMQAWVSQAGVDAKLRLLPVNYGSRPAQALDAALRLLDNQPVDVLAAYVCPTAARMWASDLAERKVPLVVCDAGANALQPDGDSPWVVRHSLGYWQANWAAGQWAARNLGRRAVAAVGALESGFDMLPAFTQGFESAGGAVTTVHFTRMPDGTSRLPELAHLVRSARPDFVFALDAWHQAKGLSTLWAQSGFEGRVPLVAAGMLAEGLSQQGSSAWTVLPWRAEDTLPNNARFLAALGGGRPTSLHLLGYEVAQRLSAGARESGGNGGMALASAMAALELETPRGRVNNGTDGDTHAPAIIAGGPKGRASVMLGRVDTWACSGVCQALASRVTDTYLV